MVVLFAILVGAIAGLVSGMFGVGGGFIIVPLLVALVGLTPSIAVGTALVATLANASGAYFRFRKLGAAEVRFDIMLIGGSVVGVTAGTYFLEYFATLSTVTIADTVFQISDLVLAGMYVLVFGALSLLLFTTPTPERQLPPKKGPLARLPIRPLVMLPSLSLRVSGPVVGVVGAVNGLLSGMMGLGGGVTLVPIMLYGFGFDMVRAAGTGVLVLFVTTLFGSAQQAYIGNVDIPIAIALIASSGIFTQVGIRLTQLVPAKHTRKILATVMITAAAILVMKNF